MRQQVLILVPCIKHKYKDVWHNRSITVKVIAVKVFHDLPNLPYLFYLKVTQKTLNPLTQVQILSVGIVGLNALSGIHEAVELRPVVILQPGGRDQVEAVSANLVERGHTRRRRCGWGQEIYFYKIFVI